MSHAGLLSDAPDFVPADDAATHIETIVCRPDAEGEVVATLLTFAADPALQQGEPKSAVLYLHGFADYFFQTHVAQMFVARGYAFYALDLRKYGRSLRPHQHPNFCAHIVEYYEEISLALLRIVAEGATEVILMGHSTGGLIAALYAAEGAQRALIQRVILNSPFVEFNESPLKLGLVLPVASAIGRYRPFLRMPQRMSPLYGESLHTSRRGHWNYNLAWKPIDGFPVYMGWVRAIHAVHKHVQKGLNLRLPVLLLHSDQSGDTKKWQQNTLHSDTVLNVEHVKTYGPRLGSNVTMVDIAGGMHDLFLSAEAARTNAFNQTFVWLAKG